MLARTDSTGSSGALDSAASHLSKIGCPLSKQTLAKKVQLILGDLCAHPASGSQTFCTVTGLHTQPLDIGIFGPLQ